MCFGISFSPGAATARGVLWSTWQGKKSLRDPCSYELEAGVPEVAKRASPRLALNAVIATGRQHSHCHGANTATTTIGQDRQLSHCHGANTATTTRPTLATQALSRGQQSPQSLSRGQHSHCHGANTATNTRRTTSTRS
ncbi:hypothetical protein Pmani_023907 [Petrolisthes manimaculis]|uniref:Uncharacterized protein n=1 Tax=Petrolisthes manimaculis TaxID=1843537 RepID=A0AAE1P8W5_9EUCA|nr:hypothetical protein Pmani_023907 [Petrolisthes manimaculis]